MRRRSRAVGGVEIAVGRRIRESPSARLTGLPCQSGTALARGAVADGDDDVHRRRALPR